jgi:hypothetical protein
MENTIKLNYDCKALAKVVNYDRYCDTTIWSVNLTLSFTTVICFQYRLPMLQMVNDCKLQL